MRLFFYAQIFGRKSEICGNIYFTDTKKPAIFFRRLCAKRIYLNRFFQAAFFLQLHFSSFSFDDFGIAFRAEFMFTDQILMFRAY